MKYLPCLNQKTAAQMIRHQFNERCSICLTYGPAVGAELIAHKAASNVRCGRNALSCTIHTRRGRKFCPDAEFPGSSQSVWGTGHGAFHCAAWDWSYS